MIEIDVHKVAQDNMPVAHWADEEYQMLLKGIELGGKAMLEGLKKKGKRIEKDLIYCSPCEVCLSWEDCAASESGYLVFIGEE